ncbi:MAG TPA: Na+/H+ antiporter subunit B, partial [Blastocatellia bacterium]
AGGFMTALLLAVVAIQRDSRLAGYFAENSAPLANGRNIVNVILVDFRALDTLGEITVLSVAAIGVFALLRLRLGGVVGGAGFRRPANFRESEKPVRPLILSTTARLLMPLMLLFSVFLLLRGHNQPGGGFIGGLVASTAFTLYALAYDVTHARKTLRVDPHALIAAGLFVALVSGLLPVVIGKPFLTGLWIGRELPVLGKAGTPLLFDTGVYLVVFGVMLMILFTLAEQPEE